MLMVLVAATAVLLPLSTTAVPLPLSTSPLRFARGTLLRMDTEMQDYEFQLAFAARVACEAGKLLNESASARVADVEQHLEFELSHEPAVSLHGATWCTHVDEHIVSVALVDADHGPVVGAVCRPSTDELLFAAVELGAFQQIGNEPPEPTPPCGLASKYANIVHVPHSKCPELEMAIESLCEKMPVDVARVPCCCCCEGLFELVCGRADVHLSPPDHCYLGHQHTPAPVLCAFQVLLL